MRWFSWFESMAFLDGQLLIHKMVLESGTDNPNVESLAAEKLPSQGSGFRV